MTATVWCKLKKILWYFQLTLPLTLITVLVASSALANPSPAIGLQSDQEEGSVVYRDQIIG